MSRFKKHLQLGARWVRCGWRLFLRNPWLLGGMGVCSAAAVFALSLVPLIGSPFIGLLLPTLLASFYIAIDTIARQKAKLPAALRVVALKQAPKEFLNVAREESRLMQVVMLSLYSLVIVVLADIAAWLAAGTAWVNRSLEFHWAVLPGIAAAGSVLLAIYLLLAASLVYTLPLALLQHQPLVPAMAHSLKRSAHYAVSLLAVLALPAAALLLGAVISVYSHPLGVLAAFLAVAAAAPVMACSLYCSFRTVFPLAEAEKAADHPPIRSAKPAR